MKTVFWSMLLVLSWMACAVAEPTGGDGIWIDPSGYIGECFVCPDNTTSDCIHAEPIYIELRHDLKLHVVQLYPVAWSEETGLRYHGKLILTTQFKNQNETTAVMACHWLREDGLDVLILQQIRLRYTVVDGWPQVETVREHRLFACH